MLLFLLSAGNAAAATRYVWQESPSPASPYTSWATAAANIQDAVDAAAPGDFVLVTNGVYATGGRAVGTNLLVNRVAIDRAITVESLMGPEVTVIEGYQVPGTTNGDGAIRCAYLTNGASLSGFTLTNGATRSSGDLLREQSGGGVFCESTNAAVTNCTLSGNSAYRGGGGADGGTLNNCILSGNSSGRYGGGASGSTLNNCTLSSNSADYSGGGASGGTLNQCTLIGNSATFGGGATYGALNHCTLRGNSANVFGGGAYEGTLNHCTLSGNSASYDGGGAAWGTLNNCILSGNSSGRYGGGAYADPRILGGRLSDSTLTGNSASTSGGGAYGVALNNCIVYYNSAPTGQNYYSSLITTFNYSCTTPLPTNGLGNIALDPLFVDTNGWSNLRLQSNSPCINAGNNDFVTWSTDLDGNPRIVGGTVDMGAYEFQPSMGVRYVNINNPFPAPPFTTWATAATNIQDAVDAADLGDTVLVTNGVYEAGARAVYGMSNRVAVTKAVTVRSVNGPEATLIRGYQVPGTTNGPAAVRCVYLANGAVLAGFTLTNGATQTTGDYTKNRSGGGVWCEESSVMVSNCVITGNSAYWGGGAYDGTLNQCAFLSNSAAFGGGAAGSLLNHCTLTGNSASQGGGGASGGTLTHCTLTCNSARYGGGASGATLLNCELTGNSASSYGGGADGGTLSNCVLTGNSVSNSGGGANSATLNNCTLTGNSAYWGGGASWSTLNNCIVYYNNARFSGANYNGGMLDYSCTTPLPVGPGNIDAEPQLASASHLSAGSPCIGQGSPEYVSGVDVDGEPWASPPSMGCDEYWSGSATGALTVSISASYTNVAVGFKVNFQAAIDGRLSASRWDFGDGVIGSNQPYASHAWASAGDYVVELRAYNESHPTGVAATVTVHVVQGQRYVAQGSTNPVPPYSSWATAATNIQDAVDVAVPGVLVWVTNGVYATGARAVYGMSNRVAVTRPVTVQSVNGPAATIIRGNQVPGTINGSNAVRCVYLTNGAVLAGFTLANGATQTTGDALRNRSGGGVWCEWSRVVASNCVLTGNSADSYGGGAYSGTLNNCTLTDNSGSRGGGAWGTALINCTLTGNSAVDEGGGAYSSTLNNCTLAGNSASVGGGACYGTLNQCTLTGNWANNSGGGAYGVSRISCKLNNCIVYYNAAVIGGANYDGATLNYSCITPLPTNGVGNIDLEPLFVDTNGWSNLRLQPSSPCINAGNNDYVTSSTDLDGNPRIIGGTVDMGAYEFVPPNTPPIADASATPAVVVFAGGACCPEHHGSGARTAMSALHSAEKHADKAIRTPGHRVASGILSLGGGIRAAGSAPSTAVAPGGRAGHSHDRDDDYNRDDRHSGEREAHQYYCRFCSTNATVVLDGSRSSDPDDDPLTCLWLSTIDHQPLTLLATGIVAVVKLPAGIHTIDLIVSDGLAQDTNSVTVTVLTAEQAVEELIMLVNDSSLKHKQPLLANLEAALASIQRGNCNSAGGQLHAFQKEVQAQASPDDPVLALELIQVAGQVTAALGDDGSPPVACKVRSLKRKPDGRIHLELSGAAGTAYIVEASTNLVDWEATCVVRPAADGHCEFEDAHAAKFPCRFYRVASP
jgi:hypothetical protein